MTDGDSLWLQKSINLSDPLETSMDEIAGQGRGSTTSSKGSMSAAEIEMIAARTVTPRLSDGVRSLRASSSARMSSLANAMGGFSPFEVDELKSRIAQLNREKLRWEDASRDLERVKAELTQSRDDYKTLEEYTRSIKSTADESSKRAERDAKSRQDAEAKVLETMRAASKEHSQLKAQLDEVKKCQAHAEFELRESLQAEKEAECLRLSTAHEEAMSELQDQVSMVEKELSNISAQLQATLEKLADAQDTASASEAALQDTRSAAKSMEDKLRAELSRQADETRLQIRRNEATHAEAMDQVKALAAEQLHITREEAKSSNEGLQQMLADLQRRYDQIKEELYASRSELQAQKAEMKQLTILHETQLRREQEARERDAEHSRMEISKFESSLADVQETLNVREGELRTVSDRLAAEREARGEISKRCDELSAEVSRLEDKLISAVSDIEARDSELDEVAQLIQRMGAEKDSMIDGYVQDLADARARAEKVEEELTTTRLHLSNERKAHLSTDGTYRRTIADLREQLNDSTSKNVSEHTQDIEAHQVLQAKCDAMMHQLDAANLEKQALTEEIERLTRSQLAHEGPKRQRDLTDLGSNILANVRETSMKKNRTEPRRVFAVSGFDGQECQAIKNAIRQLPLADLVECRSNAPIPNEVTHLVASGQLTVKLLTAAAKGCWIVPKEYVDTSAKMGQWVDEGSLGFRHSQLPLEGKVVYFAPGFKSSKHCATARLLIDQGGASTTMDAGDATLIMSTSSEAANYVDAHTWESFVHQVYPVLA